MAWFRCWVIQRRVVGVRFGQQEHIEVPVFLAIFKQVEQRLSMGCHGRLIFECHRGGTLIVYPFRYVGVGVKWVIVQ